jgi:hypothetical protein
MTAQSKPTLKGYFETGDAPTEAQFINLIDSYVLSNITQGGTGSIVIENMVKISAANYAALGTPDANTFYVIVG